MKNFINYPSGSTVVYAGRPDPFLIISGAPDAWVEIGSAWTTEQVRIALCEAEPSTRPWLVIASEIIRLRAKLGEDIHHDAEAK